MGVRLQRYLDEVQNFIAVYYHYLDWFNFETDLLYSWIRMHTWNWHVKCYLTTSLKRLNQVATATIDVLLPSDCEPARMFEDNYLSIMKKPQLCILLYWCIYMSAIRHICPFHIMSRIGTGVFSSPSESKRPWSIGNQLETCGHLQQCRGHTERQSFIRHAKFGRGCEALRAGCSG